MPPPPAARRVITHGVNPGAAGAVGRQMGRKTIIKFVGEDGDHVVTALKSAAQKFSDKKVAKAQHRIIIKMATKVSERRRAPARVGC